MQSKKEGRRYTTTRAKVLTGRRKNREKLEGKGGGKGGNHIKMYRKWGLGLAWRE